MNFKSIFAILVTISSISFSSAQENYNTLVYKGNQEFNGENYESASGKYLEAIKTKENDFTAHYNLGNSFYKRKMYDEARAEYEKASAQATTIADKSAALYNLGNLHIQTNDSKKAAELYKQALKQDPYNEAIRKNYEIAMLKEKEKEDQKKQDGKSGGEGKDQDNDKSKGKNKGDTPEQQAGNGKQDKNKGEGEGNDPDKNKGQNDGKMPKDLENSLLNGVENKERETAKRILNKNSYSMPQSNEKDW